MLQDWIAIYATKKGRLSVCELGFLKQDQAFARAKTLAVRRGWLRWNAIVRDLPLTLKAWS